MTPRETSAFRKLVYAHYEKHGRHFLPWRKTHDPYKVLVSEIMLQQTQVRRVAEKYEEFIRVFPNVQSLAKASLKKILRTWQGMGYNRRTRYLKEASVAIVKRHSGHVPRDENALKKLPGVGPATAAGVIVFAYNKPALYLETNVRSAVIHDFFPRKKEVHDRDVMRIVEKVMDRRHPRRWYEAFLDYGAALKEKSNPSRRSAHYAKQPPFKGSERELRGKILRLLAEKQKTKTELKRIVGDERLESVLERLEKENMIEHKNTQYRVFSN
ncbi:hypothetical protein A2110_00510 [Candidatus Jorgensenbacteria bacterium GWA1_54_12]|uniref:HhH-GPD domain-containing protein n=1 Tax=Candidatus Jorgensenbacteria bacterium GWA1_54_12 TaxID=1798468 RepID=A0A1F6BL19_9BACT|nr:MAG: hypothetical protein A2110_00510 [Candidatus Jorgensenbacteria bacterium GWA1_54_12]